MLEGLRAPKVAQLRRFRRRKDEEEEEDWGEFRLKERRQITEIPGIE